MAQLRTQGSKSTWGSSILEIQKAQHQRKKNLTKRKGKSADQALWPEGDGQVSVSRILHSSQTSQVIGFGMKEECQVQDTNILRNSQPPSPAKNQKWPSQSYQESLWVHKMPPTKGLFKTRHQFSQCEISWNTLQNRRRPGTLRPKRSQKETKGHPDTRSWKISRPSPPQMLEDFLLVLTWFKKWEEEC